MLRAALYDNLAGRPTPGTCPMKGTEFRFMKGPTSYVATASYAYRCSSGFTAPDINGVFGPNLCDTLVLMLVSTTNKSTPELLKPPTGTRFANAPKPPPQRSYAAASELMSASPNVAESPAFVAHCFAIR